DHRTAGVDRELHSLTLVADPRITLLGHLHVDADQLAVQPLDPGQLAGDVVAETVTHTGVPSLDDDVHQQPPFASRRSVSARRGRAGLGTPRRWGAPASVNKLWMAPPTGITRNRAKVLPRSAPWWHPLGRPGLRPHIRLLRVS